MVDATVVPAGPPLQPQPVAPSASSGHRGVHFAEASTSSADPTWAFPEADEQASVEYEAYDDEHQAAIDAAGGWTIQEDPTSGALYYYNVYTNESTYDMPPCFAEHRASVPFSVSRVMQLAGSGKTPHGEGLLQMPSTGALRVNPAGQMSGGG